MAMVEGDGNSEVDWVVTLRETEREGDGDEGVVSGYELRHPQSSREYEPRPPHSQVTQ